MDWGPKGQTLAQEDDLTIAWGRGPEGQAWERHLDVSEGEQDGSCGEGERGADAGAD